MNNRLLRTRGLVLALHVFDQVDDSAGVTELVVIPRDQLDEVVVERYAGLGVEDTGVVVADEIGRDHVVLGVAQDTVQRAGGSLLHLGLDSVVGGGLGQSDGQVDHGYVVHWHAESHAGEFSVQGWNDLADCFRGAGCGRDDVLRRTATVTPQLSPKRDG